MAVSVTAGGSATITWADTATDETGVILERSTDGVTFTDLAALPANTTSASDSGLLPNRTYVYRVRARNTGGDSPARAAAAVVPPSGTPGSLAAPTSLRVFTATDQGVSLAWDGDSTGALGYRVERSLDGVSFTPAGTTGPAGRSFYDTAFGQGLVPATGYTYRVRAFDAAGDSAPATVTATTQAPAYFFGGLGTAAEGGTYTLYLSATTAPAQWRVTWGEAGGTPEVFPGSATAITHVYRAAASTAISVEALDAQGNPTPAKTYRRDPGFGANGLVSLNVEGNRDMANAVAVQPDGKVIQAGQSAGYTPADGFWGWGFTVARFRADGTVDTSFGSNGRVFFRAILGRQGSANAVALQPDGKILVAGLTDSPTGSRMAVARLNPDGSFDTSFGTGGIMTVPGATEAKTILLRPDGSILVGGSASAGDGGDFALVRLTAAGALDTAWGAGGVATFNAGGNDHVYTVAELPDGRVVAYGAVSYTAALARFTAAGALDTTFGAGGKTTVPSAAGNQTGGLAVEPGGGILVTVNQDTLSGLFGAARFTADGARDTFYGLVGAGDAQTTSNLNDLGRLPSGQVFTVAGTWAGVFRVSAVAAGGAVDRTFGGTGAAVLDFGYAAGGNTVTLDLSVGASTAGGVLLSGSLNRNDGTGEDFALARIAALPTLPVTVTNVAPAVTGAPGLSGDEGQFLDYGFTFSDPGFGQGHTASITWGDGTPADTNVTITRAGDVWTVTGHHMYASSGTYSLALRVTDASGATATASASAAIASAAPHIDSLSPVTGTEGASVTLAGTFSDPTIGEAHTGSVDWGDGTTSALTVDAAAGTISASHAYAVFGGYAVAVTLADAAGHTATAGTTAAIADAALTLQAQDVSAESGATFAGVVATFTDANPASAPGDFVAAVTWAGGRNYAFPVQTRLRRAA